MKQISLSKARAGMVLAQDIYVNERGTAFLRTGSELSWELIDKLWDRGITSLYIREAAMEGPARPPISAADAREMSRTGVATPTPVVSESLKVEAVDTLQDAFEVVAGDSHHPEAITGIMDHLDEVVEQLVDSVQASPKAMVSISNLKSFDDYTYHHSLSVAVLSVSIGRRLNFDEKQLRHLGMTAMLHDIGKTSIPVEIIRKPDRLTNDEFALIKTHSSAGSSTLVDSSIGTEAMWAGVLHHHEKINGTGYPYGLKGNEIPTWSRIISVADVFDALTSMRPYRQPMQPAEALEYIMGGSDTDFDYDMVRALVNQLDIYPVGSLVELSDGRYALVVNNDMPLRPVVEMVDTGTIVDLFSDRQMLNVVVKRVVPEDEMLVKP